MSHKTIDSIAAANRNKILSGARHHLERLDPATVPEKYEMLQLLGLAEIAEKHRRYDEADQIIVEIDRRTKLAMDRLGIKLAKEKS